MASRLDHHEIAFWDEIAKHVNYDEFWQARNLLPHMKKVAPAVMVVGGWFDAEDLYGAIQHYKTIEKQTASGTDFTGIVGAVLLVVALCFVWRSFYAMRIPRD